MRLFCFFRKNIFHESFDKAYWFSLMLKFIVLSAVFPLLLQRVNEDRYE